VIKLFSEADVKESYGHFVFFTSSPVPLSISWRGGDEDPSGIGDEVREHLFIYSFENHFFRNLPKIS